MKKKIIFSKFYLSLAGFITMMILGACSIEEVTSPLPSYGVDIVEATAQDDEISINEGDTALIVINFERALKVPAYVNWEIAGGIGRFVKPTGFVLVPANSTSVTLSLESFKNQTIDPPTDLTVNITSSSFEESLSVIIHLTDLTLPAQLAFQNTDPFQFPTTGVGTAVSGTLTVENTGEVSATGITASSLASPFSYAGGAYPGTGGTCGSLIAAGATCTINLESNMPAPGVQTSSVTLTYNNGQTTGNTATLNLEAQSDSVVAVLSGLPAALSNTIALNVTVGGVGITQYKYKVGVAGSTDCSDSSGYSGGWTSVGTHITTNISALADGTIRLCVVGHDGSNQQNYNSATFYTWVKDTQPPTSTSIEINDGDPAVNVTNVTLTLEAVGAQFMYVTNISTCNSGGSWEMYAESKAWILSSQNTTNNVYVKYRDQLGNESACIGASIVHDNIAPTVTINQDAAQPDPTLTAPVLFKVVFSEPVNVTSFDASAIQQSGSASGITWSLTQTSPTEFDLQAVTIDVGGTIMPAVIAGRVTDAAGNFNVGSTSTDNSVIYNMVEFYFRSLSLGNEHSCGISNEGKSYCWGNHSQGQLGSGAGPAQQLTPIAVDLTNAPNGFTKIATGENFSCAINTTGRPLCWGRGTEYQLSRDPAVAASSIPLTTQVENPHSAATKDFVDVAVGKYHACYLNYQGKVYCWGQNDHGQLGNNSTTDVLTERSGVVVDPASYGAMRSLKKVVAGDEHTCALAADGVVFCWGRGTEGQTGNGTVDRLTPVQVVTGGITDFDGFVDLDAGGNTTCALTSDGKSYCWGANASGQLGNNSTAVSSTPVEVNFSAISTMKNALEIKVGTTHSCARMIDGYVYCWGASSDGRLGGTYGVDQLTPVQVGSGGPTFKHVVSLEVGANHSCGITADGKAMCWGQQGAEGRLGNNATAASAAPVAVDVSALMGKRSLKKLSSGMTNSCAVNTQGRVYCWGRGDEGQNGNSFSDYLTPNEINTTDVNGSLFVDVSAGGQHACALSTEGKVYCWGKNTEGQLGRGDNIDNPMPGIINTSDIIGFIGFKKLSAGRNHTCALHADGKMYCWGYGFFGQLGRNSTFSSNKPVEVTTSSTPGLVRFADLDTGYMHTCGSSASGLLYCWGYGALGRLGTGNTLDKTIPTAVVTTSFAAKDRVVSFSSGNENTCAILSGTSKAYCWGYGLHGRNGDFTELSRTSPVQMDTTGITNFYQFLSLDVGQEHSCGITNRQVAVCWGEGSLGRIGDGADLYRTRPVPSNFSAFSGFNGSVGATAGGVMSCSIGNTGNQYCWGQGIEGYLGNNLTEDKSTPSQMVYP